MNFGIILLPILLISVVQVAHAQSLSDSINNAVTNDIENTFDSIDSTSNNTNISPSGNDTGSQSTTPLLPQLRAVRVILILLLRQ